MKRSLGTLVVAAGMIAGLSTAAFAGVTPEKFSIGPYLGGYTFDSGHTYGGTAFTFGGKLGLDVSKHFGIEFGIGTILAETNNAAAENVDVAKYGVDLLYHLLPDNQLVPYLAAGFGGMNVGKESTAKQSKHGAFDYGIGARYYLNNDVALRADVRHVIFSSGVVRHNLEYTAGISFFFDGRCCEDPAIAPAPAPKPAPAPAPVPAPTPAKPAPVAAAPTAAITAAPASILRGQNTTLSWSSQNATDCTIDQGIGKVQPQGTMAVTPTANTAYNLNCQGPGGSASSAAAVAVTVPAPAKPTCTIAAAPASVEKGTASTLTWSSQNATACDLQPGVGPVQPQGTVTVTPAADTAYTLNCQGAGGSATSNTAVAVTVPVPEKPCQSITLNVKFDTSKADIKSQFEAELQKFADVLKENPKATAVIEGHTDNVGDADMNLKLSQRRSDSVRTFLIDKLGVAADRLTAKGYGLTKPIASNKTGEGKAKNRRIEAQIFCGK